MRSLYQITVTLDNMQEQITAAGLMTNDLAALFGGLGHNLRSVEEGSIPATIRTAYCLGRLNEMTAALVKNRRCKDRAAAEAWSALARSLTADLQTATFGKLAA